MENLFVVAKNPEEDSKLNYIIKFPLNGSEVCLKTSESWPRVSRLYCHPVENLSGDIEIISTCEIESAVKRGIAIDLILKRFRENRSQIIFTKLKNQREVIFWQTPKTVKSLKPGIRIPKKRASNFKSIEILVDSREIYAYKFGGKQVTCKKQLLRAGDYAIEHNGRVIAAVERKSFDNLISSLVAGDLAFGMAALSELDNAAVAVEGKYSQIFKSQYASPSFLLESLSTLQVRYPSVSILFLETRKISEEWTFRFLGSALRLAIGDAETADRI